jgi:hypothetical protein
MTGVFEVIAADQSHQVTAGRKAVALASRRVNERFSKFLLASEDRDDLEARLGFVHDDLKAIIAQTCDEMGYESDPGPIQIAISNAYSARFPLEQKTATVHEARKPKMCPYHKEVVDISLSEGSAKAGYEAMAQHAWGPQHCDGEFEGSCNFRREMTTQSWWDERDQAIQERREQREQERAEQAEQAEAEQLEQVEETPEAPVSDSEAPQTESDPDLGVEVESPSEAVTEAPTDVAEDAGMAMASSFREAEAVKTVDVQQRSGPSPKIDKRKWTPENLQQRVQTEGDGSPNPTHSKDVVKPIPVTDSKSLNEIGEAVTERQDVSKDSHPTPTNKRTWPTGEISAVSSSQPDVDANPIQQILESDEDGFVPQAVVQRAASTQ